MKAKWLSRDLINNPLYFTLCTSQEILIRELKRAKCETFEGITKGKGATTNFIHNLNGETVAIVCLYDHKHDLPQILSLLVHEAVHIWQKIKEIIGEEKPSAEFEAYSIQQISQQLFYEYKRQRNTKKK